MSKHSVREVLDAAEDSNLTCDNAEGMTDSEVYGRLFPDKVPVGPVYPGPTGTACTGSSRGRT